MKSKKNKSSLQMQRETNIKCARTAIKWLNKIEYSIVEQHIVDGLIDVIEEDLIETMKVTK